MYDELKNMSTSQIASALDYLSSKWMVMELAEKKRLTNSNEEKQSISEKMNEISEEFHKRDLIREWSVGNTPTLVLPNWVSGLLSERDSRMHELNQIRKSK